MKYISKYSIGILAGFILAGLTLKSCVGTSMFAKQKLAMQQVIEQGLLQPNILPLDSQSQLYYVASNPSLSQQAIVIFVHGSPGSWYDFGEVLIDSRLMQLAQLISIDRIGWGQSNDIIDGNLEHSATTIQRLIALYPNKKVVLVGHSYGVPTILQVAVNAPDNIDSLLLVSGDIDPNLSRHRFYNNWAKTWLAQKILPDALKKSNIEMLNKHRYIEAMSTQYQTLDNTLITVIQGGKDSLVPKENIDYVKQNFDSAKIVFLPKQGHLTHYKERQLIADELLQILKAII